MKILYLVNYRTFMTKMSRVRFHGMIALSKITRVHFSGIGWPDYDNKITDQVTYWKKANNCLVSVHVPGARNDMLDRAQYQFMAFGVCTISPYLKDVLPHRAVFQPDYHYVECKPDYSDLIEKIEWCKKNRKKCIQIGKNAKDYFIAFCLPRVIVRWMELCLNK